MRAGLLTTPVSFLRIVEKSDAYGDGGREWVSVLTTRARVEEEKGGLTTEVGEPVYRRRATLTVRIYHDIDPAWRVSFDGLTWVQLMPSVPDRTLQCRRLYVELLNE